MDSICTLISPGSNKPNNSSSNSLKKGIYSALLYIFLTFTTTYLFFLLHSSPHFLWIAANAIIFLVYKLSLSNNTNQTELVQTELVTSIASLPSATWHEEPKPTTYEEKERKTGYIKPVHEEKEVKGGEKDDESMDDTWKEIRSMPRSRATNWTSYLQKSDTWEMRSRLQRADHEVKPKPELKKSVTYTERRARHEEKKRERKRDSGWRTRDVLVMGGHDELFRRVENFISKQHDNMRLQHQESEQR